MFRCRSCAPWNVRDIRQMKRLTYWTIHKKSVKSLICLVRRSSGVMMEIWCVWVFSVIHFFSRFESINQSNAIQCDEMRCDCIAILINSCNSLSSCLSRVVYFVCECWPPEIIQQAIPNGPIRHNQSNVHTYERTNERTCELAFHEANQVRLVTILWFIKWVQWL